MLTVDDDKFYMDEVKRNSVQIKQKINSELFVEHIKLGLQGQIDYTIKDFCRETIVHEDLETDPVIEMTENSILIAGITAKIAVILPAKMVVTLDEITYTTESGTNAAEIIENMNALVFLLTKTKKIPVKSFFLIFDNCPDNYAWFRDDTLYIRHSDKKVIQEIYRNFQWIIS